MTILMHINLSFIKGCFIYYLITITFLILCNCKTKTALNFYLFILNIKMHICIYFALQTFRTNNDVYIYSNQSLLNILGHVVCIHQLK